MEPFYYHLKGTVMHLTLFMRRAPCAGFVKGVDPVTRGADGARAAGREGGIIVRVRVTGRGEMLSFRSCSHCLLIEPKAVRLWARFLRGLEGRGL